MHRGVTGGAGCPGPGRPGCTSGATMERRTRAPSSLPLLPLLLLVAPHAGVSPTGRPPLLQGLPPAPPSPVAAESCDALLSGYGAPPERKPPPRAMPAELKDSYTMGGRIELGDFFVDDTIGGKGSHYKYPRRDIDYMITAARRTLASGGRGGRKNEGWVVEALAGQLEAVRGANCLVFGSMEPWYEAMLLAAGAGSVTTVEYNRLTYDHPNISVALPSELLAQMPPGGWDVSASAATQQPSGRWGMAGEAEQLARGGGCGRWRSPYPRSTTTASAVTAIPWARTTT
jgi:hypothetical protein